MTRAGAADRRSFVLYFAILLTVAAVSLGWATALGWGDASPALMAGALVLAVLAELGAVPLRGGGYVSAGAAVDVAALMVLGPLPTAWINVVATAIVQGAVRRRPAHKVAHNAAAFALTALVSGAAFAAAGGRMGELRLPDDVPAMLACCAAYFLMNSLLASTALGLDSGPGLRRAWQRVFGATLVHQISFLAFGCLIAVIALRVGPWALAFLAPPALAARHTFRLYVGIRSDLKDFVRALSEVLDEVDPYTRQHSVRVAEYAVRLARGMNCSERQAEELEYAALVHDLGKIGPQHQRILHKAGALSHEDQRTLRGHPATGAGIIGRVSALRGSAEIVRLHHERPDGRGYPLGLRSDQVPLGARILNVADAFDAMTSDRPYRRALDVESALRELDRGGGSQFDRAVVDCLLELHREGRFTKLESPSTEELQLLRLRPLRART
jgi:HD-GYP domain-containing protein (c-di-GMP phosphodiesterase class II)